MNESDSESLRNDVGSMTDAVMYLYTLIVSFSYPVQVRRPRFSLFIFHNNKVIRPFGISLLFSLDSFVCFVSLEE